MLKPIKSATLLLTPALLLLAGLCNADKVYKVVDENGKVTYTDQPPAKDADVETINLPDTNVTPPVQTPSVTTPVEEEKPLLEAYDRIEIISPTNKQTIPPGQTIVNVELSLTPDLLPGHGARIIFDGTPWGDAIPFTGFVLKNLERGEHRIQVEIVNREGIVVGTSNTVIIYVRRASLLNSQLHIPRENGDNPNHPQRPTGFANGPESPFSVSAQRAQAQNNE